MLHKHTTKKLSTGTKETWKVSFLELLELMCQGRKKFNNKSVLTTLNKTTISKLSTEIKAIWKDFYQVPQPTLLKFKRQNLLMKVFLITPNRHMIWKESTETSHKWMGSWKRKALPNHCLLYKGTMKKIRIPLNQTNTVLNLIFYWTIRIMRLITTI